MSSTGQLPELELLRSQVADLARELAARDQAILELQQRQADKARREEERRLRLTQFALDHAGIGVLWADDREQLIYVNETAQRLLGYSYQELLALGLADLLPDREPSDLDPDPGPLKAKNAATYESIYRRKDGIDYPVEVSLTYLEHDGREYTCATIRDITKQKRVGQERLQTLLDLRNMLDTIPDFMFTLDGQANLVNWNKRAVEATGYRPEELLNKSALAFVPPEERDRTTAAIQQAFIEGYAELDGYLLTKDRRTIPYHWTGALLRNPQGEPIGITGIGRDVSEKKRAERELEQERQHLVEAQALAHLGSWDWNIESGQVRWSDEQFRIFGFEPATTAVMFDTFLTSLYPDDHDRVLAAINDVLIGKHPYDLEYRIVRPNGEVRFIHARGTVYRNEAGHPIRMAGTLLDITERKLIEEQLRLSEERWQLAIAGSNDGIWDWDLRTGRVFYSARWKAMRGFEDHEIANHVDEWRSRIHPDDLDRVFQSLDAYWAKRTSEFRQEYRVQRKDGSFRWVLDRGVAIWADDGKPIRMAGSETDITERKQAEESLREAESLYRLLLESTDQSIVGLDLEGRITFTNRAAQDLFGYQAVVLQSQDCHDLLHHSHPDGTPYPENVCPITAVLRAGIGVRRDTEVMWRHDGTPIPVEYSSYPLMENGRVTGAVLAITDITERKRAEARLRATQYAIDHATDYIFVIGPDGYFLDVNESACRRLGYTKEELRTKSVMDIDPDFPSSVWESFWNEFKHTKILRFETRHRSKSGEIYPVEVVANYILHEGNELDYAFVRDITERKRAEEALRASEELFAKAFRFSPDPMVLSELESGRWIEVNDACLNGLGYRREDVIGRTGEEIGHWSMPEDRKRFVQRLKETGSIRNFEASFRTAAGEFRECLLSVELIEYHGKPCMITLSKDITERKRAEADLQEMNLALANAMPGIARLDSNRRYLTINEMYAEALGYKPSELLGKDWAITVSADDRPKALAAHETMLQTGKGEFEALALRKDGSTFWKQVLMVKIMDHDGTHIGHHCFMRDITERKTAAEELQKIQAFLQSVVDNIPHMILVEEAKDFRIVSVNRSAEVLMSRDRNGMIGKTVYDLFPEDQADSLFEYDLDTIASEGALVLHDRVLDINGLGPRLFHTKKLAVPGPDGSPTYILTIAEDITERKQAEEALRQSEERFAKAFRASPSPVGITEVETGSCIDVNDACLELFGFRREEVIGQTTLLLGIWPSHDDRTRLVERLRTGNPVRNIEMTFRTKFGDQRHILVSSDLVELNGTACLLTVGTDITERKRVEEALRISEERFRRLVEEAPLGITLLDGETRYVKVNRAFCDLVGYREDELLGQTYALFTHPDDLPGNMALSAKVRTGEQSSYQLEKRYIRKDGQVIWVRVNATNIDIPASRDHHLVAIIEDITERKRAEDTLRITQYAVDYADDQIFLIGSDGYFLDVNESACNRLGYTKQELLTMSVMDIDPDFPLGVWDSFWEEFKRTKRIRLETRHRSKTGEVYPIEVTANYFVHNGQELDNAIVRDISERKRVEETLRQRERDLRAALEERERISADLHDGILQSLYAIGLGLEACKTLLVTEPQYKNTAAKLPAIFNHAIGQLNHVMKEIRNFIAGLESEILQGGDFATALRIMVKTLSASHATRGLVTIEDRAARLISTEQALHLMNVVREALSNSLRHGRAQKATISFKELSRSLRLSVTDDGVGFDPAIAHGVGHGLANMKARVRKIGGLLRIRSKPGRGTKILVDLPLETLHDYK
jgi:PAS domain S-box-containing protein